MLVIHGKGDIITSPHDSVKFYKNAGSKDKTLKIIPHAYHEPMHDTEASEYKQTILDFLEENYEDAPKFGNRLLLRIKFERWGCRKIGH